MKVFYSWCACALMDFATLTSMNVLRNLVKMELVAIVMSTFTLVNVEVVAMVPIVRSTMKMDVPLSYMNRSTCIGHTINYTCIHAEGSVGTVKFQGLNATIILARMEIHVLTMISDFHLSLSLWMDWFQLQANARLVPWFIMQNGARCKERGSQFCVNVELYGLVNLVMFAKYSVKRLLF